PHINNRLYKDIRSASLCKTSLSPETTSLHHDTRIVDAVLMYQDAVVDVLLTLVVIIGIRIWFLTATDQLNRIDIRSICMLHCNSVIA
ncbi:MAG: hypothetical protein R6X18_04865, partial [Chloroflexota bacterium]